MQEFGFIDEEEYRNFNKIIKNLKEIILIDFQFKATNRILVTKSSLHKINKVDNNNCEHCNRQPETIYHFFVECETVRRIWNELHTWLGNNSTIRLELGEKQIIFAYQDSRNTIRNYYKIRYHKLRKAFSKFYRRHFELVEKYHVSLKKGNKAFVIQNFMEIWYINLRKSLEIQTSLIF